MANLFQTRRPVNIGGAVLFTMLLLAFVLPAQSQEGARERAGNLRARLNLYINGPGRVVPFHNGQLLRVGDEYNLTAVPDHGSAVFTGWNRVNVFIFIETTIDIFGNTSSVTNTVPSVLPGLITRRTLRIGVEPPQLILEIPGVRTVFQSSGWQANFVRR